MIIGSKRKGEISYLRHVQCESEGRFEEARTALNEALKAGNPMAMHARAYELYNQDRDKKSAIKLYKRAAKKGLTESMINIAVHHKNSGNTRYFIYWIDKAANAGDPIAIEELNFIHERYAK